MTNPVSQKKLTIYTDLDRFNINHVNKISSTEQNAITFLNIIFLIINKLNEVTKIIYILFSW